MPERPPIRALRRDPDDPAVRQALASLARGSDLVFPSRFQKWLRDFRQVHAHRKEEPPPQSPPPGHSVPAFYFPCGRPPPRPQDTEDAIALVECAFEGLPRGRAGLGDMAVVAKACGCPLYWKAPLFYAAGGERTGSVSVHMFVAMWRKVLLTCHDDAARFVRLLGHPGCSGLIQEDFVPFLQDVVNSHPGLAFLRAAKEFHSRYITTVSRYVPNKLPALGHAHLSKTPPTALCHNHRVFSHAHCLQIPCESL